MKKPGEFDVVGQVAWKKSRRVPWPMRAIFLGAVAATSWQGCLAYQRFSKQPTVVASGSGTILTFTDAVSVATYEIDKQPPKYVVVTGGEALEAMDSALEDWRIALGGKLPIKRPRLVQSPDGPCSNFNLLAFAEPELNRIVFCRGPETGGLHSVMLHEVGHLLGVPHIQDDPLMNSYRAEGHIVDKPTPFAIAIAKAAHAK